MLQLSYADTHPKFSEIEKYPNFFRTVPSETQFNPARRRLLERFNWTIVGIIKQDEPLYSLVSSVNLSQKSLRLVASIIVVV